MPNFNSFTIVGHIASDLTIKQLGAKNTDLCEFRIAAQSGWGDKKSTAFLDCKVWGKKAPIIEGNHQKGDPILITGEITQENWEAKDGGKRSKIVLLVNDFAFMPRAEKEVQNSGGHGGAKSSNDGDTEYTTSLPSAGVAGDDEPAFHHGYEMA